MGNFRQYQPTLLVFLALLAISCSQARQEGDLLVTLLADGSERSWLLPASTSVSSFLSRADVELGPLDRIEPPLHTMLHEGMRITIVRVLEEDRCERHPIPFQVVGSNEPASGTAQRVQAGLAGEEERCHRVLLEDGIERDRAETSRVVIREPVDEIWQQDTAEGIEPLSFPGTLVWTSDGNAWLAQRDSSQLRQLTRDGSLDGKVLALSSDGSRLLFTRSQGVDRNSPANNRLWLIADLDHPADAIQLLPENVLQARWMPDSATGFGYTDTKAKNAISIVRIDPGTGEILSFRELLAPKPEGGLQPTLTRFNWSGDGRYFSWAQGNSIGILDMSGDVSTLISGIPTDGSASATCASHAPVWSPDNRFVATGLPATANVPSSVSIIVPGGGMQVPLATNVGPCPAPVWAPQRETGLLAWLRARDPDRPESRAGHDLMIVDRDGSNERLLFPETGQAGLEHQQVVWSPDSRQLAFTWQDELWMIDVGSGNAQRFPFSGRVSGVEWAG